METVVGPEIAFTGYSEESIATKCRCLSRRQEIPIQTGKASEERLVHWQLDALFGGD